MWEELKNIQQILTKQEPWTISDIAIVFERIKLIRVEFYFSTGRQLTFFGIKNDVVRFRRDHAVLQFLVRLQNDRN